MRNMSFALTTEQVRNRTKHVTRRYGWDNIKVGELIQAVEQSQGLKKGENVKNLDIIRVTAERWEPLTNMVALPEYGAEEVILEGFPDMAPIDFVLMVAAYNHKEPYQMVHRIAFEYADEFKEGKA